MLLSVDSLQYASLKMLFVIYSCTKMSQDSQHGKWTISDSEDEDNIIPPTPQKDLNKPSIKPDLERKPDKITTFFKQEPKLSPKCNEKAENSHPVKAPSAPSMGSEARKAAHVNQTDPVKYESSSPAVKRKRETEEGGWNLSSSDDEAPPPALKNEPKKPNRSPKRKKTEDKRPPSPHGTSYYKEEPADFFETNSLSMNGMYRFYLNKVTGIPKKFNTGALHIKGI